MGRYIKSYSNYVLKKKHQTINDGIIYERDITTIGGRNQFAKGQIPIYANGNFVITTNNDNASYKKTSSIAWEKNDTGDDVWTLDVLNNYEKDEKSSYDERIVIKKDYYDLRDFAYYGSCSELIRASINNILKTYPGELYVPLNDVWVSKDGITFYTEEAAKAYGKPYETKYAPLEEKYTDTRVYPSVQKEFKLPFKEDAVLFAVSNPFGIDVHSKYVPEGENPLKYFAELGYENYVGYKKVDGEWDFDNPLIIKPGEFVPYLEGNKHFTGELTTKHSCELDAQGRETGRVLFDVEPGYTYSYCPGDYLGSVEICFYRPYIQMAVEPQEIKVCEDCDGKVLSDVKIGFEEADVKGDFIEKVYDDCEGHNRVAGFKMRSLNLDCCIKYHVFLGDNNEIKYFVDLSSEISVKEDGCDGGDAIIKASSELECDPSAYRIRPNERIIDDYYKSLDIFERLLLDDGNTFTSFFEIISENEYGYYTKVEKFVFPTTYGGYNLGSSGINFTKYLEGLIEVGEFYDERFSDNLWRSMTHESIKNFDWTYTRHYTPGEEEPYVEGGEKIQKIIRLYGREFDEIKSYIDNISNVNTITYDNVNNLPDYFFTDKLEDDGWDVKLINPLKLREYVDGMEVEIPAESKEKSELMNEYNCKKITRVFNSDFDYQHIKPYSKERITSIRKTKCGGEAYLDVMEDACDGPDLLIKAKTEITSGLYNDIDLHIDFKDNSMDECVDCKGDGKYTLVSEVGESQKDGYHDDCCNFVKIYSSEKEYKMSEINSEFLKRFILNSKEILRHKGTIEGIEMLLGLFGLRSKNYALTNETYFKQDGTQQLTLTGERYYKKKNINTKEVYDYDIKEYTLFTTRLTDSFDATKNMFYYDWINSTKLSVGREYESYQGLPVSYRDYNDTTRYLYPSFQDNVKYDGNPYYQMNGGWLSKKPFMFDVNNNIIPVNFNKENGKSDSLFTETVRNIKAVQTLRELLGNKSLALNAGDICQVVDLSGRFAIVDGVVYDLFDEADNVSYFYVTIENNSLTVGNAFFTDYVYISNPYGIDGLKRYDLNNDSNNGRDIKVYVIKQDDGTYKIDAHSNTNSITTFTVFENGKYMEGDNYTHYFRVNNPDFFNELSVLGWQQLKDNDYEYFIMDSIVDNNKGNNPHTGHMNYDNGHEYLTYFSRIFKYSLDNRKFDTRELDEYIYEDDEIYDYGFKNLIDEDECVKDYDIFLKEDTKCHYFGDYLKDNGEFIKYGLDDANRITDVVRKPVLSFDSVDFQHYGDDVEETIDGVTNQIVNTKRVEIDFYISSSDKYSNEWLEEIKYIDSVILPYLTQMLPSTIICSINYKQSNICK